MTSWNCIGKFTNINPPMIYFGSRLFVLLDSLLVIRDSWGKEKSSCFCLLPSEEPRSLLASHIFVKITPQFSLFFNWGCWRLFQFCYNYLDMANSPDFTGTFERPYFALSVIRKFLIHSCSPETLNTAFHNPLNPPTSPRSFDVDRSIYV